ncbi:MAG TPA: hypothetical protein VGB18_03335 [Candidatus Thermoplasmatota archaeon]
MPNGVDFFARQWYMLVRKLSIIRDDELNRLEEELQLLDRDMAADQPCQNPCRSRS